MKQEGARTSKGELRGGVAVVTGGGSGIGKATAQLLAAEGAKVVVADVESGSTTKEITERGGDAMYVRTDVRRERDAETLVQRAVRHYGGIDILCNNAGVELVRPLVDTSVAEWDRVIDTNLKGIFLISKHVLPIMIRNGRGAIINIASQLGVVGLEKFSAYCASKGGVISLTRAMALEYAPLGVRVNCVCPGAVDTPMVDREVRLEPNPEGARRGMTKKHPMGRLGRPEEIAQGVLFLASERASFVTGASIVIDGGYIIQ